LANDPSITAELLSVPRSTDVKVILCLGQRDSPGVRVFSRIGDVWRLPWDETLTITPVGLLGRVALAQGAGVR
jgi:hypothetical protein